LDVVSWLLGELAKKVAVDLEAAFLDMLNGTETVRERRLRHGLDLDDEVVAVPRESQVTPDHDDKFAHWYRTKEFPIALCGHVSLFPTLKEALKAGRGRPVCGDCDKLIIAAWDALHDQQTEGGGG